MLKSIAALLLVLTLAGCASSPVPIGPRLRTNYGAEPRHRLDSRDVVMICLAGVALEVAISAAEHDEADLTVAEIVCEAALESH